MILTGSWGVDLTAACDNRGFYSNPKIKKMISALIYVIVGPLCLRLGVYEAGAGNPVFPRVSLCLTSLVKENFGLVNFPVPPRDGNFLSRLYCPGPGP